MKIHVTQEHINLGRRQNCTECPIARALSEHFGKRAMVMPSTAAVAGVAFKLPPCVGERIVGFDQGYRMVPFTFTCLTENSELFPLLEALLQDIRDEDSCHAGTY
jgi:hypothetical protein